MRQVLDLRWVQAHPLHWNRILLWQMLHTILPLAHRRRCASHGTGRNASRKALQIGNTVRIAIDQAVHEQMCHVLCRAWTRARVAQSGKSLPVFKCNSGRARRRLGRGVGKCPLFQSGQCTWPSCAGAAKSTLRRRYQPVGDNGNPTLAVGRIATTAASLASEPACGVTVGIDSCGQGLYRKGVFAPHA
jgi:hypothetical protein